MQISEHYGSFPAKTAIVVTNHDRARIFTALGREVNEVEILNAPEIAPVERITAPFAMTNPSLDNEKSHNLEALYHDLNERLANMIRHEGFESIIACVPEINKNLFTSKLDTDVQKAIGSVVPKNLANMEMPVIMRILLEG